MRLYEGFLRPILFLLDPERAHDLASSCIRWGGRSPAARRVLRGRFGFSDPALEMTVAGIRFANPIGLAAGFDKDCRMAHALPSLGFGFLELGTITPLPQPGNPRPRLFRVPEAGGLINRFGFNNDGAEAAAGRLRALGREVPIGINIGKGRDTPREKAVEDYQKAFSILSPFADYVVVNVSSPNTKGLRDLQEHRQLEAILAGLRQVNSSRKPIFVKLSPDIPGEQLGLICPVLMEWSDGAVVSNTTLSRDSIPSRYADVGGGLSGAPLKLLSRKMVAEIYARTHGKIPIIGVGGVFNAEDAFELVRAGASLVQVYTGFIYRGPSLIREIQGGLLGLLKSHGFSRLSEAVGSGQGALRGAGNGVSQ